MRRCKADKRKDLPCTRVLRDETRAPSLFILSAGHQGKKKRSCRFRVFGDEQWVVVSSRAKASEKKLPKLGDHSESWSLVASADCWTAIKEKRKKKEDSRQAADRETSSNVVIVCIDGDADTACFLSEVVVQAAKP